MPTPRPSIALVQSKLEDVAERVEKLDGAIRGNGKGLVTKVALLDNRLIDLELFVRDFEKIKRWMTLGVAGLFGTLMWNIFEWYIASGGGVG